MAYSEPHDETTPADSDLASGGDDAIRQHKRALNERLSTYFTNWPDGDPLEGPAMPAALSVGIGILADKPNPATSEFYFATDEGGGTLYVKEGTTYKRAIPLATTPDTVAGLPVMKRGAYNDALGAGTRVTDYGYIGKVLSVMVTGHTDSSSFIIIDLDEFSIAEGTPGSYTVANLVGFTTEIFQDETQDYPGNGELNIWQTSTADNTITLQANLEDGTNVADDTTIMFMLTMFFRE